MQQSLITAAFTQGLPEDSPARGIRVRVFMNEQGFLNEFDEIDPTAWHLVLSVDGKPAAAGRTFPGEQEGHYVIGRVCVLRNMRGLHLGARVLSVLEDKIRSLGGTCAELSSQCQAQGFYEKQGYQASGEIYMDEHCPHIHMEKQL